MFVSSFVSVGLSSNIAKYTPLDMTALPGAMPAAPEPGRTEARVSEFYRRLAQTAGGPGLSQYAQAALPAVIAPINTVAGGFGRGPLPPMGQRGPPMGQRGQPRAGGLGFHAGAPSSDDAYSAFRKRGSQGYSTMIAQNAARRHM